MKFPSFCVCLYLFLLQSKLIIIDIKLTMNPERLQMLQSLSQTFTSKRRNEQNRGTGNSKRPKHRHHHRHTHNHKEHEDSTTIGTNRPPNLNDIILPELSFPAFSKYDIQEAPDFNTSCEEEEEEKEEEEEVEKENDSNVANDRRHTTIDRLRSENGGIDLGLNRTDLGRIESERDYHDKHTRKMINYETQPVELADSSSRTRSSVKSMLKLDDYEVPFEFGDRGSNWRMMKLNKLDPSRGRNPPSKSKIFEQYSTIWDYELACLERDELEKRKHKGKRAWVYKPCKEFMNKRKYHLVANKKIVDDIVKRENDAREEKGSNYGDEGDDRVVKMNKYSDVKISKSKKIRNELKLAHLTSLDYADPDEHTSRLTREQIEALTNSP